MKGTLHRLATWGSAAIVVILTAIVIAANFMWAVNDFAWSIRFLTSPELWGLIVVVGVIGLGLYGMGSWLRGTAENDDRFWLRWWVIVGTTTGIGLFTRIAEGYEGVVSFGVWILFAVLGIRASRLRSETPALASSKDDS